MKTILIILCFCFCIPAYSQFAKGNFVIGASVDMGYNKIDNRRYGYNNLDLGVSGQVFVTDRLALGIKLFESFNNSPYNAIPMLVSIQNRMYGFGVLTKYCVPVSPETGFIFNTSFSYQYGENTRPFNFSFKNVQYSETVKLEHSAGMYFFIHKNIVLEPTLRILAVQHMSQWSDHNLPEREKEYFMNGVNVTMIIPDLVKAGQLSLTIYYLIRK